MTQKEMLEMVLRNQVAIMGALALEVDHGSPRDKEHLRNGHARGLRTLAKETMEVLQ